MIDCEKKTQTAEIAKYVKIACGMQVEYSLVKKRDGVYIISVFDGFVLENASVEGDFLEITEFFGKIVNTFTLPDNLSEIAEDFNNTKILM